MNEDRPSVEELVGRAVSNANIGWRIEACPLDRVIALGLSALSLERNRRLKRYHPSVRRGATEAVFGLKIANQPASYSTSLEAVRGLARGLAVRHNWRIKRPRQMAKRVLDYWLNDTCPRCTGRKFERQENTPLLADRVCSLCHGSGKRRYPWGDCQKHKRLLVTLESIEELVIRVVARRVRGRRT